jgi:hypothetical protein
MDGLSPEAQAVESRTVEQVELELDGLIEQYRERFGVVVGTDLARELFPDYTASLQSRLQFALAVQRSAAYVADEVYKRILSGPVLGDALFTAGGTGAGKTTAIRASSQTSGLISEAAIVYDSNFNSLSSAKAKVTLALEAGLRVIVIFVHRHPVEAYLEGVLPVRWWRVEPYPSKAICGCTGTPSRRFFAARDSSQKTRKPRSSSLTIRDTRPRPFRPILLISRACNILKKSCSTPSRRV